MKINYSGTSGTIEGNIQLSIVVRVSRLIHLFDELNLSLYLTLERIDYEY